MPPRTPEEGYHLSEDLADDAIAWLHRHQACGPDKPFFMYWATGCLHAPHHIFKEWADKYAGKFDDGWDAYRERVFHRAKERGWIPADAQLTPRDPAMPAWTTFPRSSARSSAGSWRSRPATPTRPVASDLGGTRNPMVVRWPAKITPDATPRSQFHHCNDVVPTIYELVGIDAPRVVHGVPQDPIDGVSFAYAFDAPDAPGRLITQYFEIMGSRAIYHDGWMASATGPRLPWVPGLPPGIADWTPDNDVWRLYNLDEDWTQANDLAAEMPDKLAQMKEPFAIEAARNSVFPIGGGLWVPVYHPELRISTPYREWNFAADVTRMPEFCTPALGNRNSPPAGPARIEITTEYAEAKPGGPLNVTLKVNGDHPTSGVVPVSAPLLFTANDCLDISACLGGSVSLDYYDRAPFPFNGTIETVNVRYTS